MSIERITTHVVDCDEPGCDERFGECIDELTERAVEMLALRDGWAYDAKRDAHYCPTHADMHFGCKSKADWLGV